MSHKEHKYEVKVEWTGNRGSGTSHYRAYGREHVIQAGPKPPIPGSSDPAFLGDPSRWNPEDLLVASLSACHQLWYLHLCCEAGVEAIAYCDHAEGLMIEDRETGGRFTKVILRPQVTITKSSDVAAAQRLHHDAHAKCYIANSVNFPVTCEAEIFVA